MRRPHLPSVTDRPGSVASVLPASSVVVLVLVGLVAGLLIAGGRTTTYEGRALLRAQAPAAPSGAGDASAAPTLAAASAALVGRPDIVKAAATLVPDVRPSAVRATARVQPGTAILEVRARTRDGRSAAAVARAFGLAIRREQTTTMRSAAQREADALRRTATAAAGGRALPAATVETLGQLRTLADTALPLAIVRTGEATADVPRPPAGVYGITGGAIAGVFALAGFAAARGWRRRGRRVVDLPALRSGPVPVLGAVPRLQTFDDGRTGDFTLSSDERELFRVVRRGLHDLRGEAAQVVLVTSAQPSAGKSTTAVGLAAIAAEAGQRVLLVECDLRLPTQADRLSLDVGPGLSEYLAGRADPASTVQRAQCGYGVKPAGTLAASGASGTFFVVTAGIAGSTDELDGQRMDEMLGHLRRGYDLVVLDAPPLLGSADAATLVGRADTVLVCARLGKVTWDALEAATSVATRNGRSRVGLVATGVDRTRDPAGETRVYGAASRAGS